MNPNIRWFLRNNILDLLSLFSKPAKGIHILNGHMISKNDSHIEVFLNQLEELNKITTFIKIEDAVDLITQRKKVDDVLIAFSFDDGFEECATMIAPALEQFGTNGLFFINPNFVEGDEAYIKNFTDNIVLAPGKLPMRWDDIIKIRNAGHVIGAHTLDHFMINNNDLFELEHQIGDCKKIIEANLGEPCDYFAIPFGKLEHANPASLDLAEKYYKYVFTQSNYKSYFSYNGKAVNRRHFEPNWPVKHVKYFISHQKKY